MSESLSWSKAILKSKLDAVTKHLLLTIDCHVDDKGNGCLLSVDQLCDETARVKHDVIDSLTLAYKTGWIEVEWVDFDHFNFTPKQP